MHPQFQMRVVKMGVCVRIYLVFFIFLLIAPEALPFPVLPDRRNDDDAPSVHISLLSRVAVAFGCEASGDVVSETDCTINRLYHGLRQFHGESHVKRPGGTYGEVTSAGVRHMVTELAESYGGELSTDDVLLDAGSGVGKVPVQVFLEYGVSGAFGVEFHHGRCASGRSAVEPLATKVGLMLSNPPAMVGGPGVESPASASVVVVEEGRRLGLLCGDMRSLVGEDPSLGGLQLSNVTVVFTNSICYPADVLMDFQSVLANTLQPGALIISSQALPGCHRGLIDVGRLDLSGTKSVPARFRMYVVAMRSATPSPQRTSSNFVARLAGAVRQLPESGLAIVETHWDMGVMSSAHTCAMNDLAARAIAIGSASGAWESLVRSEQTSGGIWAPLQGSLDRRGDSLYHLAVELRSVGLLRALTAGGAPPGLHAPGARGESLCHREMRAASLGRGKDEEFGLLLEDLAAVASLGRDAGGKRSKREDFDGKLPSGVLTEMLVNELGASCITLDERGRLPLHWAVARGNGTLVSFLLNASNHLAHGGALLADNEGATPLHLAGSADVALVLLEARADVDVKGPRLRTPLHYAAEQKAGPQREPLVRLLLHRRADPSAVTEFGKRPDLQKILGPSFNAEL